MMTNIDKHFRRFVIQAVAIIGVITLITAAVGLMWPLPQVLGPMTVGCVFSLAVALADGMIWRKVARNAADSLPTFFMAVSGARMFLALAVMLVYYVVEGSQSILVFFVVFMVYYIAILAHHTLFFAKDRTAA